MHDFLVSLRGADRVFLEICDLYPDADIFIPIHDERATEGALAGRRVHTSFLQRLRPTERTFRTLLPLYPAAIESFDLTGYELVVSSSSAWAHAVVCDERATHVCYCHNPFRYVWNERHRTLAERRNVVTRTALNALFRRWRAWDWLAAQRVDRFLTNSETTRVRIGAFFGRESDVLHPPVRTERFAPGEVGDHYLVLSELMSHKRIDTAVEAFSELGLPLVVVGGGPELARLRRMAGPTVRFTGRVDDAEVERLLASCRALVVTAAEEFGIAAVEAQAAGRPVLARSEGGALETVVDGVTGRLWDGDAAALAAVVRSFDPSSFDSERCVENARRFDAAQFRASLQDAVADAMRGSRSSEREVMRPERPTKRVPWLPTARGGSRVA